MRDWDKPLPRNPGGFGEFIEFVLLRFKYWYWELNSSKDCPFCHRPLLEHGFEGHNQRYTCQTEGCSFGDEIHE